MLQNKSLRRKEMNIELITVDKCMLKLKKVALTLGFCISVYWLQSCCRSKTKREQLSYK